MNVVGIDVGAPSKGYHAVALNDEVITAKCASHAVVLGWREVGPIILGLLQCKRQRY